MGIARPGACREIERAGGGDRNRFFLDPARVTRIRLDHAGLKLIFHDSIYVGMSGG